ncbi:ribonuclease III domain-containing protein [Lasiosphaeria hispida]|uniref:Large ribosomal subunit protein mL44 n=1 Tax=Lasiosphaeria hispida TaxID=260671 RepID=A0AAJ0HHY0_9PEZI|nr:ribonuclease III domain-containing protein [Lasiosphaeria hispida]
MKRLRADRWTGQLLVARSSQRGCCPAAAGALRSARSDQHYLPVRSQWTAVSSPFSEATETTFATTLQAPRDPSELPSPIPERALHSAKLASLHARLSLPKKLPIQTLARTLVDASADENPLFNNVNLAFVGQTVINYHVSEYLMARYPRLPMEIVWASMRGFAGVAPLFQIARSWGVESAAVPGGEVDPGLLQFTTESPGVSLTKFGYRRTEAMYLEKYKWRRGISNRVVFDDDFGESVNVTPGTEQTAHEAEMQKKERENDEEEEENEYSMRRYGDDVTRSLAEKAHAHFVRAVVGAVYMHCGRDAAHNFIKAHILSRTLDFGRLFSFKKPTMELALLCDREDFDPPVARLLSETGRQSRTPVYVVGIFSGKDKLGEAAGPNLDHARLKAAMNALKAWYLYSPGEHVRVPSDMLADSAKKWEPAYIDIGEIISR